jgi:hypothetical protein
MQLPSLLSHFINKKMSTFKYKLPDIFFNLKYAIETFFLAFSTVLSQYVRD